MQSKTKRRVLGVAALVAASGVVVGSASATIPPSTFNAADGNIAVNGTETDWATPAPNLEVGPDLGTGQNDNSFGQGSSENDTVVTVVTGSIPNSKADLGRFAVASETAPNGDVFMYLAWTRNNQSGSTNFDFELNKVAQPDLTTPGSKNLNRSVGDLLINYSLQGGAQVPTLNYRTWTGTAWSDVTPLGSPIAEASINSGTIGSGPIGGPDIIQAQFGEASINMSAAGIIPNQNDPDAPCAGFGSAYVKSRSSQSFQSEIKDFVAPVDLHLDNCGTIVVEKFTDPVGGTDFDFTLTGGPSALNESFTLDHGESYSTGADVKAGSGYVATEAAKPGWDLDSATCTNGSPANIVVVAGQTTTCTFRNKARANLHVLKTAERNGVSFDFTSNTLTPASFSLISNSGVDQDFLNLVPGPYDVAETEPAGWNLHSSSCTNGDSPALITLEGGDDVTCTFHNVIERGAIDISKVAKDAANGGTKPLQGVVFTVTGGTLPAAGVTATTDANGQACVSGLPVSLLDGNYTVTETVPAGYAPVAPQTVTVVESTCGTAAAVDASFVNVPLTNVTISVDSQVPGGTASEISCTSAQGTSTGSTDATGDGSVTVTDLLPTDPAVTITCTVIVDP